MIFPCLSNSVSKRNKLDDETGYISIIYRHRNNFLACNSATRELGSGAQLASSCVIAGRYTSGYNFYGGSARESLQSKTEQSNPRDPRGEEVCERPCGA